MKTRLVLMLALALTLAVIAVMPTMAAGGGNNGTTLVGYKTIDICKVNDTTWHYSGEIAVWNTGVLDTVGFSIFDFIENKTGTKWIQAFVVPVTYSGEIPAGTTLTTATVFKYTFDGAPLPGTIRNNASLTILNHSNYIGKPFGPNPKATYNGSVPPPACPTTGGCVHTIGYWGAKPGTDWPTGYNRDLLFFSSPYTWGEILPPINDGDNDNGYYQLARQYIGAVLNAANGAYVPQGVQNTLNLAAPWLSANAPSVCTKTGPGPAPCGEQKDWAAVLDNYNNGLYEGAPHCE